LRPPLEAQLIDLADEVAYNTADLDDAYSARFFDLEAVAREIPEYSEIQLEVETQFPGATERVRFNEGLRRLIDLLVSGLIEGTGEAVEEAGAEDVAAVRRWPGRLVRFSPAAAATSAALKQFLRSRVYFSEALAQERRRAAGMVAELFGFFMDQPGRLPDSYREASQGQPPHRVVCDYIAGMTDGFFRRTYEQTVGH
jgi:dGTPase